MHQTGEFQAKRLLTIQVVLTLGLAVIGSVFSRGMGLSLLIGGAVCTLANGFFAWWIFRRYRAQQTGLLLLRFYGAEIAKIALILAMFVSAFALIPGLLVPALLAGYFVVQVLPSLVVSDPGKAKNK